MSDKELRGVPTLDSLSSARLWKTLDSISDRLLLIEQQLTQVVRLEERVNQHDQLHSKHLMTLDNHNQRIHNAELWQASNGGKSNMEENLKKMKDEIEEINRKVNVIESRQNVNTGQKDVVKEVVKWVFAIVAAVVIFNITKGK